MNRTSTAQPRTRARHAFPAALALLLATAGAAHAQEFAPGIGFVYPAGGKQGTTFRVTVGGQHLVQPSGAIVSGAGVRAIVIPTEPLLNPRQATDTRDKIRELRQQKNPALRGEIEKLSRKIAAYERARIIPAIGARATLEVTIAPDAPPGNRELRLFTAIGLTNPLVFQVGTLPECSEPEAKQDENPMRQIRFMRDPDNRAVGDRDRTETHSQVPRLHGVVICKDRRLFRHRYEFIHKTSVIGQKPFVEYQRRLRENLAIVVFSPF